jgi:putative transposase
MDQIDEIYTEYPYYWSRRIYRELHNRGYPIWRKKTRKLMQVMGIIAIYPKKKTSIPNNANKKYPYLLEWTEVIRANQVRSTDITYIKIPWGFVYLMAVIDRYSRYIVAWDIGISMDADFCCSVLKKALSLGNPEIFNSDQWSQFTSNEFLEILENKSIQVSMDGKGRCYDNIRIERLWRTIKYEDVHIHEYQTPNEVYLWLSLYINKYNNSRLHSSLDYHTPSQFYTTNI